MLKSRHEQRPRVVLVVLDGFGERAEKDGNAIRLARTPNFDRLYESYPWTLIGASGNDVGLPDGQMGNSEVGHLNLGAGRIVYQDIVRIDKAIKDGTFYRQPGADRKPVDGVKASGGTLHLFGLTSPGNVHASLEHAYAVCELAKRRGLTQGRRGTRSSTGATRRPSRRPATCAQVDGEARGDRRRRAGLGGRALLRDGSRQALGAAGDRLEDAHARRGDAGRRSGRRRREGLHGGARRQGGHRRVRAAARCARGPTASRARSIKDGDACFFYNFRADRARQLTLALHAGDADFPHFDRGKPRPKLAAFATMTQYDAKVDVPAAFPPQSLSMILGEVLSKHGVSQLRTAETEKYAHVTYFFNGGVEQAFPGEERKLVPSNREVATYDLAPEMSAAPVTDGVVEALKPGGPTFILVNYANPDMVGHTGKLEPAIHAVETIDTASGASSRRRPRSDATVFITADHGNCETMIDPDDRPAAHGAHDEPDPVHRHRQAPGGHASCARAGGSPTSRRRSSKRWGSRQPPEMDGVSLLRPRRRTPGNEHRQAPHRSGALRAELAARQGGARRRRR